MFLHKLLYLVPYFTKFAGNVYGYENISVQNFGFILKNSMAAIADALKVEILQLASSDLHKR